nr:nucleotidyl transferase AbiEii/AbiGii toxin family protein [Deinococcus taeanensis]
MTRTTEEHLQARRRAESIRARLKNLGKNVYMHHPSSSMLLLYTQQGFLARLMASPYAHQFVLKGALSLFARYGQVARPTEDIDLAARGTPNTPERLLSVLKAICAVDMDDGLTFDADSIQVQPINEGLEYPGVGVRLTGQLDTSRIVLQIDVSFGNVITPAPVKLEFPALLLPEAVTINAYSLKPSSPRSSLRWSSGARPQRA